MNFRAYFPSLGLLPRSSAGLLCAEFFGKHLGLSAPVRLVHIARLEYSGDKHFADHFPFQQRGGTLHGNPHAVHYGFVLLLANGKAVAVFSRTSRVTSIFIFAYFIVFEFWL